MKVSLSSFLRWGGRKESREEPEPSGAFWGRKDRRRAARRVLAGSGLICWIDESGEVRREPAAFTDVSDDAGGLGAVLRRPAPIGPHCWAICEDGVAYPLVVRHCEPCAEGFRLGARINPAAQVHDGWGSARLKWMDAEEMLTVSPASIRNADDGLIQVNAAINPPANTLLLLEGRELACLCALRKSSAYGERRLLEVEPVLEAAPAARREAAA